jgi:hypothetical protein
VPAALQPCELPPDALLRRYMLAGAYTDCYRVDLPRAVTHADYVLAFYTTWLFRLERWILAALVRKPSTDEDVQQLALGNAETFAAWNVEARAPDQLLLTDFRGETRSWLMIAAQAGGTRLYFGSAVVPGADGKRIGPVYRLLLGFHKLYSRALLRAAAAGLR